MATDFKPDLYDGEAVIEAHGQSFAVEAAVATGRVPRNWFGHLTVPDASQAAGFGDAVTQAFSRGENVALVLSDGRCGVVEIDDSLWFEGSGPWRKRPAED